MAGDTEVAKPATNAHADAAAAGTDTHASTAARAAANADAARGGLLNELYGSFVNTFKSQANGLIQLGNKAGLSVSELEARPVSKAEFGSLAWGAQLTGQLGANVLTFATLRGLGRFGAGTLNVGEGIAARTALGENIAAGAASSTAFGEGIVGRAALNAGTGAVMGGLLTPTAGDNFWTDRLKAGTTQAVAFGIMGGVSGGMSAAAASTERQLLSAGAASIDGQLLTATLRNGYLNTGVGGFLGGATSAEVGSLLNGTGHTSWQDAGKHGIETALIGMGAHGVDRGAATIKSKLLDAPPVVPDANGYIDFDKLPKPWSRVARSQEIEKQSPSAWYDTVGNQKRFPTLRENVDVDVAVVGAGVAGLQTARMLSQNGFKVAVVEANRVGAGATSQMAAMIDRMPDWGFGALTKHFGEAKGGELIRELRSASDNVIEFAKANASDFQPTSTYKLTSSWSRNSMRSEVATATKYDPDFRFIEGDAAAAAYPGAKYAGVAMAEGVLNPRKFAMSLATSGDFRLFEDSPAIGLTVGAAGQPHRLHTPEGTITANKVVFATGGAPPLFDWVKNKLWSAQVFGVKAQYEQPLKDSFVSSREPNIDFWRPMATNQVLFGGSARPLMLMPAAKDSATMINRLTKLLPGAEQIGPTWNGTIFITGKYGLPMIAQDTVRPDIYAITGLGGSGLVNSALAAKMIVKELQGKPDENLLAVRRR
jgi:gamma-glutamylputrescine oxidase